MQANSINIASMQLSRANRGGSAIMVFELDQGLTSEVLHPMGEIRTQLR